MFGIGPLELIIVTVVALVFIGPQRLPEAMRKLGRVFVQVRRQTQEVRDSFNEVVRDAERDLELERIRELKNKMEQVRSKNLLDTALDTEPKKQNHEYHDSHYVDGEYSHGGEGFLRAEDLPGAKPLSEEEKQALANAQKTATASTAIETDDDSPTSATEPAPQSAPDQRPKSGHEPNESSSAKSESVDDKSKN
jgi:Tat protein translocase TatB subunit